MANKNWTHLKTKFLLFIVGVLAFFELYTPLRKEKLIFSDPPYPYVI